MEHLKQYLQSLMDFSDQGWELLQPALTSRSFLKNDLLLAEGKICQSLYFITKGCAKSYFLLNDEVKNTGFFLEGDLTTNISSFSSGQPSAYYIQACEPLEVVIFDKRKLLEVASKSHEIESLGRLCIREFATKQEGFSNMFKLYSAQDRLAYLEREHPQLIQRVPLLQLASFLGVARETLSRIRKRRLAR